MWRTIAAYLKFYWRLIAVIVVIPFLLGMFAREPVVLPAPIAPESTQNLHPSINTSAQKLPKQSKSNKPINCSPKACLALTFDDGPSSMSTAHILDALKKEKAHATFFLIGRYIKGNEDLVRRIYNEGNDIGNHSWDHPYFTKVKPAQMRMQIKRTQQAIDELGLPEPVLFRPPYGDFRLALVKYVDLPVILWNVDPKDWAQKNSKAIAKMVEAQAKPGAIIVLHDHRLTAGAVAKILRDLRAKYEFVTVSQLMGLTPKSRGIFIGR